MVYEKGDLHMEKERESPTKSLRVLELEVITMDLWNTNPPPHTDGSSHACTVDIHAHTSTYTCTLCARTRVSQLFSLRAPRRNDTSIAGSTPGAQTPERGF